MTSWAVEQVDWGQLLLAAFGLLVAGLIKGTTGLGYSTCALPFLVSAVGLRSAIVIVPIPALAANLGLLFGAGNVRETRTDRCVSDWRCTSACQLRGPSH